MRLRTHALVALAALAIPAAAIELPKDVSTADVCALVPGAEVAKAVGGTLAEAKLVRPGGTHARCRYTVTPQTGASGAARVYLLWLLPAADFDDMRRFQERPVTSVDGVADAAFTVADPDSGRHEFFALLRGVATVEVSGPDAAGARAVAGVALRHIQPAAPGR